MRVRIGECMDRMGGVYDRWLWGCIVRCMNAHGCT
jgi:hypothetical protein